MQIKVKRKDAIWNFIGTVLSMGANLIILPVILYCLKDDDIAIYYIFTSLAGIAALFDFGFAPSMARSMAYAFSGVESISKTGSHKRCVEEPNYRLMKLLVSSCKVIYASLATVALLLALIFGTLYILKVSGEMHGTEYVVPWIIYAISIFLNILFGYYSVFLRGVGAVAEVNEATIFSRIIQIALTVGLLLVGCGLYGVSIAYLLYGLVFRVTAKRKFFNYRSIGRKLELVCEKTTVTEIGNILSQLWPNTWRDGLVTLSNYFVGQATTILASVYLSLNETGVLSLCIQLITAIATVAQVLLTVYQPAMQSSFVSNEVKKQKKYLSTVVFFYIVVFWTLLIALYIVGLPVIGWIKPSYCIDKLLMLEVGVYFFILYLRNLYCSYISTTNRLMYYKSFVIASFLCIVFEMLMGGVLKLGANGLVLGQLMSQIVFCAWYWPYFVHKELKLSLLETLTSGFRGVESIVHNER